MSVNDDRFDAELDKFLNELTKESLKEWRRHDRKRMGKNFFSDIKNAFLRFDEWFAQKFGWFFCPKRYK